MIQLRALYGHILESRVGLLSLLGATLISGCVANNTLPSQNIGVLLDTSAESQTDPAKQLEPKLAQNNAAPQPPSPVPQTSVETQLSPTVKNAIVPTTRETPAQTAAKQAVKPADATIKPPASVEETTTAKAKKVNTEKTKQKTAVKPAESIIPKETQVAAVTPTEKAPAKSLFGAFLQSNQANKSKPANKAKKAQTRKTAKRTTKVTLRKGQKSTLPGVKLKKVWGIETDEVEERDEPVRVAAVTNLARRGTHGLLLQRKDVKVGCFPRDLLRILKKVERRFGRTPIVTSGYRSRAYNRRIRGAKRSQHIYCKAADIQVRGVSKWKLAKYMRTIPGRGGVGTYCHTASVHIDVGQKRDWNRRCRRKRRR